MFPLKELYFQGRRRKDCLWVDCNSGKTPSRNSAHEDRKRQLRWSEMGNAKASEKRAGQKHTAWLRAKTGHRFNEKDMPF